MHMKSAHLGWIYGISWHPDGTKFATCSEDNSIKIWESGGVQLAHIKKANLNSIRGIDWHPDGTKFATCSDVYSVKFWKPNQVYFFFIFN